MTYGCGCDVEDNCSCTRCDRGECDHVSHCDNCSEPMSYKSDSGCCFVCEAKWLASHQLMYRNGYGQLRSFPPAGEPVGVVAALVQIKKNLGFPTFADAMELAGYSELPGGAELISKERERIDEEAHCSALPANEEPMEVD
jgi:hypothetical protein